MLTRAAVAKRLGRSLATVRRMEGTDLHPWVDDRGIHRFDASEVDAVAERDRDTTAPLPPVSADPARSDDAEAELAEANRRIAALERRIRDADGDLKRALDSANQASRNAQELRSTAVQALEIVETLLGDETPNTVRRVLLDLQNAG